MSFFPARTPGLCCQHHRASRVLSKLWERLKALMNFLKYFFYFFILGCARCLLLCEFLSSCDEQGPLSSWGVRAACWGGLSCRRARARGAQAAAAAARGLGSCSSRGSRVPTQCLWPHGRSCSVAGGIFPAEGSNQCLLHWRATFFTTEPGGKPWLI